MEFISLKALYLKGICSIVKLTESLNFQVSYLKLSSNLHKARRINSTAKLKFIWNLSPGLLYRIYKLHKPEVSIDQRKRFPPRILGLS